MVTFAVTLSDLIEKGGAYAGLAAFFGLAILSILYFAQAREIRRLRDWAGRAPERAQELEQRVVQQAETARRVQAVPMRRPGEPATAAAQRVVATPEAKPAAKPEAIPAVKPEAKPAVKPEAPTTQQPAVPSEPVFSEGEKPAEEKPAEEKPAETEVPAVEPEATPTEHPIVAAEAAPAVEGKEAPAPAEGEAAEEKAIPAGATTALAGGGTTAAPNGAPPPVDVKLPPRATQGPARPAPAPAAALRSSTSVTRRPPPPPRGPLPPSGGDDNRRTPLIAAGVFAGIVLIVVGLIAIIGGGDEPQQTAGGVSQPAETVTSAPTTSGDTGGGNNANEPPTISRADTTIAVLNGTTISGLAASIDEKLTQAGYTEAQPPTNYTDQARSASIVFYNGSENRTQAIEIAKLLKVSERLPIDEASAQLAPGADVVVVVGADQTP